ncbi:MAG: hypothetical protein JXA53_02820 [Bacteroidales bacterium]|nr:hypothetical protein [Bacteroidales bacterium]
MEKTVYFLSTCDTCKRIMKEVSVNDEFKVIDLKENRLSEDEIAFFVSKVDSISDLINKHAVIYKEQDLKNKQLSDDEIESLLIKHYTLIKRPIFIIGEDTFIGNSRAVIEKVKSKLL